MAQKVSQNVVLPTLYFSEAGEVCTQETLRLSRARADNLGIKDIVVASTRGIVGAMAVDVFSGFNVVVVTHAYGFREPNSIELTEEARGYILAHGGKILTTSHAFGGVARAVRRKFNTYELDEIIAQTFRIFGQGMKVVAEMALMAADSGLIPVGPEIISIAGRGKGADTAVVMEAANSQDFFNLKIKEILCKPRL